MSKATLTVALLAILAGCSQTHQAPREIHSGTFYDSGNATASLPIGQHKATLAVFPPSAPINSGASLVGYSQGVNTLESVVVLRFR